MYISNVHSNVLIFCFHFLVYVISIPSLHYRCYTSVSGNFQPNCESWFLSDLCIIIYRAWCNSAIKFATCSTQCFENFNFLIWLFVYFCDVIRHILWTIFAYVSAILEYWLYMWNIHIWSSDDIDSFSCITYLEILLEVVKWNMCLYGWMQRGTSINYIF